MSCGIEVEELYYRAMDTNYEIHPHRHKLYQWYLCLGGEVTQTVERRQFVLQRTQSILIPPDLTRSPRRTGGTPVYIVAIFANRSLFLEEMAMKVLRMPPDLLNDTMLLADELRRPSAGDSRELSQALLLKLLIGLRRTQTQRIDAPWAGQSVMYDEIVDRAVNYIRMNCHRSLSREEIASSVNYSAPQLARIFRRTLNMSVGEKLREIRLEKSKKLLLNSTLTCTQVAMEVGMGSFSHFSKVFTSYTGMSPGTFRHRHHPEPFHNCG